MAAEHSNNNALKIGDLLFDPARRRLWRGEKSIHLPKLSYNFLQTLIAHAPEVVTTEQLLDEVWGDVVVSEETVKQRVSLMRQALDDDRENPKYIESVRGVGYRLIARVSPTNTHRHSQNLVTWLMIGAVVAMAALLALFGRPTPVDELPGSLSLAVLPFEDLSESGDKAYFSDGIHEEVIAALSQINRISVTSRTSVLPFRDAEIGVIEIGERLDVDLIVEGSVRHSDDRVRVTVQLINAKTDEHIWVENYDRPLSVGDIFDIQSDVAGKVATAMRSEIVSGRDSTEQKLPTDSLIAYEAFLLGRYHLYRGNAEDLNKSVDFFTGALREDPAFTDAYIGRGLARILEGTSYGSLSPTESFLLASRDVTRALELEPELPAALALRGDILTWYEWRFDEAEAAYRKAVREPGTGVLGYMLLLSVLQRHDEALKLTEEVVARYPHDHWVRSNAAWRYLSAGNAERAIDEANAAIAIDDQYGDAFGSRGWAQLSLGNVDQAVEDFERHVALQSRSAASLSGLAVASWRSGDRERAESILSELESRSEQRYVQPEEIARILVAMGRHDEAMDWLNIAYESRSRGLIFLKNNESWNALGENPEFQQLLAKVGLDDL